MGRVRDADRRTQRVIGESISFAQQGNQPFDDVLIDQNRLNRSSRKHVAFFFHFDWLSYRKLNFCKLANKCCLNNVSVNSALAALYMQLSKASFGDR